jgi:hypothetical protein
MTTRGHHGLLMEGARPVAWDAAKKGPNVSLTSNDSTAAYPGGAAWQSVLGTFGHASGLRQYEVFPVSGGFSILTLGGAANEDFVSFTDYVGSPTSTSGSGSLGYHNQSGSLWLEHLESDVSSNGTNGGGIDVGDVMTVGIDFPGNEIHFFRNGSLVLTRTGFASLDGSKIWYPAASVQNGTIKLRGSGLAFPIPGYTDWDS